MGARRRLAALIVVAFSATGAAAGCAGDSDRADPAIVEWSRSTLGLDEQRADCVALRLAAAQFTPEDVAALTRSDIAGIAPDRRQAAGDAVTVCSMATDQELDRWDP